MGSSLVPKRFLNNITGDFFPFPVGQLPLLSFILFYASFICVGCIVGKS